MWIGGHDGREKEQTKISKRRQKAKQQKAKKRKLRLIKGGAGETSRPSVIERPGMPYLGAPEGFRSISFSQAIMEYGSPLAEQIKDENALESRPLIFQVCAGTMR